MFDNVVESSYRIGPKKRPTLLIAFAVFCAMVVIGFAIEVAQVMATDVLPKPPASLIYMAPVIRVVPVPTVPHVQQPGPRSGGGNANNPVPPPPTDAPPKVSPEPPGTPPATPGPPAPPREGPGTDDPGPAGPPVKADPPIAPVPEPPVRPGPTTIAAPTKVFDAIPKYPAVASSARIQGVVILEATIGIDGKVQAIKVLRSVPMLDAAAVEAVSQWRYTPTKLNGRPVAVIMTVTVNFTLQ